MYCLIRQGRTRSGLSYAEKMKLSVKGDQLMHHLYYLVIACVQIIMMLIIRDTVELLFSKVFRLVNLFDA